MPEKLRWIALCLPTTLATQAMRNVLERGWGFDDAEVVIGYGVSVLWIGVLILFSAVLLRFKNG